MSEFFLYIYNIFCIYVSVLLTDPNASPVIQTLLLVLHKNDLELCQKYIHKVIKSSRIKNVEKSDNPELMKYVWCFVVKFLGIDSICYEKIFTNFMYSRGYLNVSQYNLHSDLEDPSF